MASMFGPFMVWAIWIRYQHRQAIRKIRRIMNRESIHEPKA
jgi:hypothetical protein